MRRSRAPSVAVRGARALRSFVAMRDIVQASLSASEPEEVYRFALARVAPLVDATFASVYLMTGASGLMRLAAAHNWPERFRSRLGEMRVRVPYGPSGRAAAERRVVRIDDVESSSDGADWNDIAAELGFRAIVAVPMIAGGEVVGVLTFYFAEGVRLGDDAIELMQVAADQLAAVAEKTRLHGALHRARAALAEAEAERDRLRVDATRPEPLEH